MNNTDSRREIQSKQFPNGIPRLWCPTLTHFQATGVPDESRIRAHLQHLAPFVKGILVPGSTGEGWEMNDDDIRRLLEISLDAAQQAGIRVLVGVLRTSADAMLQCLDAMQDSLAHPAVAGVAICPPKGSELSQSTIHQELSRVLQCGWPTALYQLPQVTQNEMSAETVASLASEFANFILFKDTSGTDKVALHGRDSSGSDAVGSDYGGVFMVRGSEQGGYASWTRQADGPYDGFLLSTANVFARELMSILTLLDEGNREAAQVVSANLAQAVERAFASVSNFPVGNAFANANKVLDHCMAHGIAAAKVAPPILYTGSSLPVSFIHEGLALLQEHSLLPERGYCE